MMKKLVIGTAVAGGAALALIPCRDMMHDHDHDHDPPAARHPQQPR